MTDCCDTPSTTKGNLPCCKHITRIWRIVTIAGLAFFLFAPWFHACEETGEAKTGIDVVSMVFSSNGIAVNIYEGMVKDSDILITMLIGTAIITCAFVVYWIFALSKKNKKIWPIIGSIILVGSILGICALTSKIDKGNKDNLTGFFFALLVPGITSLFLYILVSTPLLFKYCIMLTKLAMIFTLLALIGLGVAPIIYGQSIILHWGYYATLVCLVLSFMLEACRLRCNEECEGTCCCSKTKA